MTLQMEPPAPPPRRSVSTSCDLHPDENFTGFCTACLRERLAGLEATAAAAAAPGRKSTSAIRSLFSRPFAAAPSGSGSGAAPPDLRRCKSFSCGRGGAGAAVDEPQRRSCDVRGRSTTTTLWSLFHQDDRERVRDGTAFGAFPASSSAAAAALPAEFQQQPCVPEVFLEEEIVAAECPDEITPVVEEPISAEMEAEANSAAREVRAMKDHIDLESRKPPPKDLKEIAGSFWLAASVFSKKWQKWRRKQKLKKEEAATGSKAAAAAMPPSEKPSRPSFLRRSRLRGEEFAGGRRSCDTDPRFSLDAARMSVDDVGLSWDGPRASWDGYLFGAGSGIGLGRAPLPMSRLPPILSALEDSPAGIVERSDGQIPVEDDSQPEPDGDVPGGSAQTRDYYMDSSSSRRRRSLDRSSSSARRRSFEVPDPKPAPAAAAAITNTKDKESPLNGSSEFYHFHHAQDLLDHRFSSNSLIEDFPASLDAAFPGPAAKKPRRLRKAWSLWGFIHRRATGRARNGGASDRAFSEPWPELRARGYNARMQRCSSNASARSSFSSNNCGLGSSRRSFVDGKCGGNVKRQREECVLERNRSARYSPPVHAADNGMLRFYLTPMGSASGRRTPGPGLPANGGRHLGSHSFTRNMLRLY
ncbi:UPF0503 protein At3g09070, chloroplastic [Brachypodium distachyon]|uniref:Uncharacterized protein n=1 Tax=Brachypodium distachyon TaxID=15368 RepID=I1HIW5_BRADI|nr:UPF0503 protein At3g09070, chloroplastic [Brachypodium distachyon]KQK05979.1 hypothetical protein BRADI_2g23700v3 [Brachypodium distachyon]|eukprot:XP_003566197.1 UPF0503 protein At3g09070, chloroplastic [Brachypodium distachyon]